MTVDSLLLPAVYHSGPRTARRLFRGTKNSQKAVPLIGIVEDEESIRESISSLLRPVGYRAALFESAEAFLSSDRMDDADCLVLDVRMPGLSGLDLQRLLSDGRRRIPIIFGTAQVGDDIRERAIKQGAAAFLRKHSTTWPCLARFTAPWHPDGG